MPRRRPVEDDPDLTRWAISWADFLTLLFAFFVVMYGISSVNQEKYRQLSESLSEIFARQPLNNTGEGTQVGTPQGEGILDGGQEMITSDSVYIEGPDGEATARLEQLRDQLNSDLTGLFDEGEVQIDGNQLWFTIEIRSSLLFGPGDVIPAIEADPLLRQIALLLAPVDNPIHVEGYTDDEPIESAVYPSNWELSAARAAAVVRLLQINGLDPERMAAVGYGEYRPAYSNRTAEGRRLNRRIVVVVSRDERVRRAVMSSGSESVSEDTIKSLLVPEPVVEDNVLEQVETETGIIFRRAEIGEAQEP